MNCSQGFPQSSTIITSANWQFTPNHLPGSQQFSVGGSQVLRGFPGGVFNGDNGVTVSVENRFTVMRRTSGEALLQLSPYLETGRVWSQPGVSRSKSEGLLWSAGLGINWQVMPGVGNAAGCGDADRRWGKNAGGYLTLFQFELSVLGRGVYSLN